MAWLPDGFGQWVALAEDRRHWNCGVYLFSHISSFEVAIVHSVFLYGKPWHLPGGPLYTYGLFLWALTIISSSHSLEPWVVNPFPLLLAPKSCTILCEHPFKNSPFFKLAENYPLWVPSASFLASDWHNCSCIQPPAFHLWSESGLSTMFCWGENRLTKCKTPC